MSGGRERERRKEGGRREGRGMSSLDSSLTRYIKVTTEGLVHS